MVPSAKIDKVYADIKEYTDLPAQKLAQIKYFFEHYKDLESGKWVKVQGYDSAEVGHQFYQRYRM